MPHKHIIVHSLILTPASLHLCQIFYGIGPLKFLANGLNIVGCFMLGVVAQNLKPVKILATCKRMQQLTTLLRQQCWELLLPFAHSLTYVAFVSISFAPFHPIPSRTSRTSTTWLRVDRNGCYACHPGYWTHICRSSFSGYNSFVLGLGSIVNIFGSLFFPPYSARPC